MLIKISIKYRQLPLHDDYVVWKRIRRNGILGREKSLCSSMGINCINCPNIFDAFPLDMLVDHYSCSVGVHGSHFQNLICNVSL